MHSPMLIWLQLLLGVGYAAMFTLGGLLLWKRSSFAGMALIAASLVDLSVSVVYVWVPLVSIRHHMTNADVAAILTSFGVIRTTVHYGALIASLFSLARRQ